MFCFTLTVLAKIQQLDLEFLALVSEFFQLESERLALAEDF